ncbi:hypothetical protein TSAR_001143 [Trichomalopsis sarcophagae]|uniref:Alcohol dehydrogenase n=1 Tax=Trichomalopsis sarcophagae TaxID=543379 RepID=A0A232EWE6_9HYME|nr:hypothetical protein TSAR_001143 [Trichomalopsis sarcophagae]
MSRQGEYKDIKDKVIIVTGGANGIGLECVLEFLEKGARYVAIFDITPENFTADKLQEEFGTHRVDLYHCDIANEEEFRSNFKKVIEKYNYVDILINDAGVANENDTARLLDVNVKGTILGNLIAIEHMGKHKGGRGGVVVNVASVIGLLNCHVLPVYSASKHAIVSFTRSMKSNYDRIGVKIIAVCPGHTRTKLNFELAVETSVNYLDFIPQESIDKFNKSKLQYPDNVSDAIMDLITDAEPGTVWVVENDEPHFKISSSDHYTKKIIDNHEAKVFFCW